MKYFLGTIFTMFAVISNAQMLTYSDGTIDYDDQIVKTINIKLDPKPSTVRSSFEDWMDDKYDVDLDGRKLLFFDKDYMKAEGVVIPEISSRKLDLIVKVDESVSNSTTLHVFASFGYDNWITMEEYPYEFAALESIVYEYVADYLPEYYAGKVEDTRENLEDLREDRADMQDDMKENEEEIAKLMAENKELMSKLRENQNKINSTKSRLTKRNQEFKSINNRVKNK